MSRLMNGVLAAATLALLFFVVAAASSSITTTITVVNDENPSRCRQQIEQSQRLHSCQQYLVESSRSQTTTTGIFMRRPTEEAGGGWREQFQRCCQQLEQMEEQCRCEGVREVVQQQRQRGELRGLEMREMLQTAEALPPLCRMGPSRCDVQPQFWF